MKLQKYGIKFPITSSSEDETLFDVNNNRLEKIKSEIMHLIFTPLGQRLRKPDFGTRLIQYIFAPDDSQSWADVVNEIKSCVGMWIDNVIINDIELGEVDNGHGLAVKIKFSVTEDDGSENTYELINRL